MTWLYYQKQLPANQQQHLEQQRHDQRDDGIAANARILHDFERARRAGVTAEGIGRNAAELLRKVRAAQYVAAHPGEVCPAKWEEGEETLAPSLDLVGKI